MKKYLHLYINACYSYIECESEGFFKELNHRLFYFQKYNPQFGRLKYKIIKKYCLQRKQIVIKKIKTFDDIHINFMCDLNMSFDGHYKYIRLIRNSHEKSQDVEHDDHDDHIEDDDFIEDDDYYNMEEND